jgi:hypothetical protein
MDCTNCTKYSRCEIIVDIVDILAKMEESREQRTLDILSSDFKKTIEDAKNESMNELKELQLKFFELKDKQYKCFRRRRYCHFRLGYTCFRD